MTSWLALHGADLRTKHYEFHVADPASEFLFWLWYLWEEAKYRRDEDFTKLAIETMDLLLPMMDKSTQRCLWCFGRWELWKTGRQLIDSPGDGHHDLLVEMSPTRVCKHVLRLFEEHTQFNDQWK